MSDDSPDPRRVERLTRAAQAAQKLSEVLWETLQEELGNPRSERVTELSEQLGELVAIVASLARVEARAREMPVVEQPVVEQRSGPEPSSRTAWEPSQAQSAPSPAVLVDELAPEGSPEIEIRDERGGEDGGPAAWIGSIGRRLERHRQDGSPFAVLLVEIVGIERLRQAEPPEELARLTNQVEEALTRGLRPADSLTREGQGRYWLLAPQTDVRGAQPLAERIARAVRSSAGHRGAPLEVAVGIAVCPDDGRQASELAAHADVELYAARAAGRSSIDR